MHRRRLIGLNADGPAADRAARMDLYAWLIGSWDLDVIEYHEDGSTRRRPAEWHFGWVLEGRAIQDVWIIPPRGLRQGDAVMWDNTGTMHRARPYDPDCGRLLRRTKTSGDEPIA